jgi:hypothetical protein
MRLLCMLAVLLFLAAAVPGVAAQSPTPQPSPSTSGLPGPDSLKILACSLEYNSFNGVAAKMHVDFMNLNAQPVTHIRFRVQAGFSTFAVMDVGNFAPNLRIHHDLDPPMTSVSVVHGVHIPGMDPAGLYCGVDAFTLVNGYTWISPQLKKELQQQQQQKTHTP